MKIEAALAIALFGIVSAGSAASAQSGAEQNVQRLLNGQVQWPELTPAEREEIIKFDRLLRSIPADKSSQATRCWRGELDKADSSTLLS